MDKVPGMMRLGLATSAPSRTNPGFTFAADSKNRLVPFDKTAPSAAASSASAESPASKSGTYSSRPAVEAFVPPKFALAGQKLTFRGFFQEGVPESPAETARQRHLIVVYHLEDDSVEVLEPAAKNDGLMHGKFLKRMRIPDITVESLRVGTPVEIFSRAIFVYACDEFSRKFYDSIGQPQADDIPVGKDSWSITQAAALARIDPESFHGVKSSAITRFIEAAHGSGRTQSFKKDLKGRYLEMDGQVLRFLVLWDDTVHNNMFGEKHLFWLSYFLASEEVEIREVKGKKQYMGWSTLLRRSRLPRKTLVHDDRMRSVEDVTGDEDYYGEDDFVVGSKLNVYGRTMVVCDCDDFTQKWYLQHKGRDQKAHRIEHKEPEAPRPVIPVPPHTGIGSEEDTLESWKHLIPRQPKVDFNKMRAKTGKTVKYMARLVSSDPINAERVFRITWFIEDDELAVYEPPVRNSGILSGVFQKKKKMKNAETGEYFKATDFAVGRRVVIKGHVMDIFLEEKQPEPTIADVDQIMLTLKKKLIDASASLRKMFRKFDTDKSQTISFEEFQGMLNYYALGLNKYEAITLFKAFEDKPGFMSYANFMRAFAQDVDTVKGASGEDSAASAANKLASRMTHEELEDLIEEAKAAAHEADYRANQELLVARIARAFKNSKTAAAVHDNFRRFDVNKDHMIDKPEFRQVMGHGGLYLTDVEIETLIDKFYIDGDESLDYEEFMSVIHLYADKVMRS